MRKVGNKVRITTGGYSGLNYFNLVERGWTPSTELEIVKLTDDREYPYVIKLPDNTTLQISEWDIYL